MKSNDHYVGDFIEHLTNIGPNSGSAKALIVISFNFYSLISGVGASATKIFFKSKPSRIHPYNFCFCCLFKF